MEGLCEPSLPMLRIELDGAAKRLLSMRVGSF